ncbi:MAG: YciI family protein [Myxococcota bacterium]
MKYLALIYSNEQEEMSRGDAFQKQVLDEYMAFEGWLAGQKGVKLGGNALQPTPSATTVRVRNGKTLTTDGPFAETKEQLGGYYLLEAKDLDEAIKLAARIPTAKYGSIEVRPIMEFN